METAAIISNDSILLKPFKYSLEVAKTLDVDKLLQFSALVEQAESRVAKAIENGAEVKGDVDAFTQRAKSLKKFKVAA